MIWNSWLNAEIYDRFVREHPIYSWLNRTLVEIASLPGVPRILDLACGTGATTIACLPRMDARAEIVGIDSSAEMIEVARANIHDPRARFDVLRARDAGDLPGTFGRALCNAAFWQFPAAGPVLAALARKMTGPGARFVYNVPADRVAGEPAPIHPFQVALMQEIRQETGVPFEGTATTIDPARLEPEAARHGFAVVAVERRVYNARQAELMELMTIPAMIEPLTPEMPDERRAHVLAAARERCDPDLGVSVPWIYFVLERRAG